MGRAVPSTPIDPSPDAGASAASAEGLPRTFGRYTLFELIGRGGMAEIYLARQETDLGATRLAVVKQILPAFSDDPRFGEMLTHEAKLAAQLNHARIVQVYDLGRENERLYIAMEYVEGFDLNALLRMCTETGVGLPVAHALGVVADVLEGLDYAHRRKNERGEPLGVVHRDVSPSNILISVEGEVKLCDFGIAHANDLVRDVSSSALKGKAGYMSPEHARGEALDARADVFAAGIVLWELLAGHRLYRARDEMPLLEQARRAEIPPLPDRELPNGAELERIVRRALARDREDRYPTAQAMLRDLEAYLAANGLLASRLKLREWLSESFGDGLVEKRRASERRLPKTIPPSRPGRASSIPPSVQTPPPTIEERAVPREEDHAPSTHRPRPVSLLPISSGAMRAFRRDLQESKPLPVPEYEPLPEVHIPSSSALPATPPGARTKRLVVAIGIAFLLAMAAVLAQKLVR